jgi:hypothetical protein
MRNILFIAAALMLTATAMAQPRLMPESRTILHMETGTALEANRSIEHGFNLGFVAPIRDGIGLQVNIPVATVSSVDPVDGLVYMGNPYIGLVTDQHGLSMRVGAFIGGFGHGNGQAAHEGFWLAAPYSVESFRGTTSIKATGRYRNPAWEVSPVVEAGFTSVLHTPDGRIVSQGLTATYAVGIRSEAYGIEAEATVRGWTSLISDATPQRNMQYASMSLAFQGRFTPVMELVAPISSPAPARAVLGVRYRM